jgi:hypothetical protein
MNLGTMLAVPVLAARVLSSMLMCMMSGSSDTIRTSASFEASAHRYFP